MQKVYKAERDSAKEHGYASGQTSLFLDSYFKFQQQQQVNGSND